MENVEIALLLSETADLMEIAEEDGFRIRSDRNGAGVIESYPERVEEILKDPARKLTDIPGIGKGLAAVLEEDHHGENADEDHIYLMSEEAYAYFQAQVERYMPTGRSIWTPEEELQEARGDRRIPPENVNELEHLQNVIEFQCRSALCRKMELLGTALPGIAFAFGYVEQPEANPPTRFEREPVI